MPCTPASANAWRTSSSLNGLITAVMSFIVSSSLFCSCSTSLADGEVLLDAEDERRVAAGFAVVKIANDEVGAIDVGDGEIYALIFDGVRVAHFKVVTVTARAGLGVREHDVLLEVSAPDADLVVRPFLRRDRDRREVVVLAFEA